MPDLEPHDEDRDRDERSASDAFGDGDGIPPRLRGDLRALYDASVVVPPAIDEALRREARERLADGGGRAGSVERRFGSPRRLWGPERLLLRIAALVVIALGIGVVLLPRAPGSDINLDGFVDVLDAFELARRIDEAGGQPLDLQQLDINADGVVDPADVRVLLARVVELPAGGGRESS